MKQALEQLSERVGELSAYVRYFGRVQLDTLQSRIRRIGILLVMGLAGVLWFTALTFVLLLYCIHALARGFAAWAEWPLWAGELLIGAVSLLGLCATAGAGYYFMEHQRFRRRQEAYDERVRDQQTRFDRNVHTAQRPSGAAV